MSQLDSHGHDIQSRQASFSTNVPSPNPSMNSPGPPMASGAREPGAHVDANVMRRDDHPEVGRFHETGQGEGP